MSEKRSANLPVFGMGKKFDFLAEKKPNDI